MDQRHRARDRPLIISLRNPLQCALLRLEWVRNFEQMFFPLRIILNVSIVISALGKIADSNTTLKLLLLNFFQQFLVCMSNGPTPRWQNQHLSQKKAFQFQFHNATRADEVIDRESLSCRLWNSFLRPLFTRLVEECAYNLELKLLSAFIYCQPYRPSMAMAARLLEIYI